MDAETELLQQVSNGVDGALRSLYEALAGNVHALAWRMLHSREDAEEVVQDTFVKVHAASARFDPSRGSPRSWVYAIARNECRMRLRARGSRPQAADGVDLHDPGSPIASTSEPSPEAAATDRLTVHQAFANLSTDEARLLEDAYFGGYSHAEIAERESEPLGTVKSRLRRAMLKARATLSAPSDARPAGREGRI
ncbi:MAG: RNA polymerase sigma factor [Trueperaceae bacterium]